MAIDPGREKCGVALLDSLDAKVLEQAVVARAALSSWLEACRACRGVRLAVIGHRTLSDVISAEAERLGYEVAIVNEDFSTEEARERYWRENPPCGWRRLLPRTLLMPPRPVDDYAAVILGERYLRLAQRPGLPC